MVAQPDLILARFELLLMSYSDEVAASERMSKNNFGVSDWMRRVLMAPKRLSYIQICHC